jgi:hypothetical protein
MIQQCSSNISKETFQNVMRYDKEPAADRPMDQGWQDTMTSDDVVCQQRGLFFGFSIRQLIVLS